MTIQEAALLAEKDSNIWIRPVTWSGGGMGLVWTDLNYFRGWKVVPGLRGGCIASMPDVLDIIGEWEAKKADEILEERNNESQSNK